MKTYLPNLLSVLLLLALPTMAKAQFTYTTNNGAITITGTTGLVYAVTIPSTINDLPVTRIGTNAFVWQYWLTNLTIGSNVISIEESAFNTCFSLTNVTLPDSVISIGDWAFFHCSSLISVQFGTNLASIGKNAFTGCSLTNVMLADSVIRIGDWAFSWCTNLASVRLSTNLTSIGEGAFYHCNPLSSISLPNGVTNLGARAFFYCSSLTAITVAPANSAYSSSAGVLFNKSQTTLIEYPASKAESCYTLPSSVTNLGPQAFENCTNLTKLFFQGNAPSVGYNAFAGDYSLVVYYLPWTTGWSATYAGVPTVAWNPQSLVQNGDFETGDFTGWTLVGNTPGYNTASSFPRGYLVTHSGRHGAYLGDIQLATFSQTLATVPGQYYWLSLWLRNPTNGTVQRFNVNWNTNSTTTNTLLALLNPPAFSWTNFQFLLAASSTNTTLQIQAENDPAYFGLDDISVIPVPSPTLEVPSCSGNSIQLSWATAPGASYQVQYKTNLWQTNWINLTPAFVATSSNSTLLDTNSASSSPQRFYRLRLQTP